MKERSRHLVDPELLDFLEQYPAVAVSRENLNELRARWLELFSVHPPDTDIKLTVYRIPAAEGAATIEIRIYRPVQLSAQAACVLNIHSGGFIWGSVAITETIDRGLSRALQCVVASVEYRLAPETCFPGNVEDCYSALKWLFEQASDLAIDRKRIGAVGLSAGGGLAAALALLARDRGEVALAFQHLNCPMLDDRTCLDRDPNPYAGEFAWTRENNEFGWSALLGGRPGLDEVSPYAAPARATVLQGLPPTFIATGALDLFVDENVQYAHRLLRAGVPTELHVYPGAFHGFEGHPTAAIASIARSNSMAALKRFIASR